MKSNIVFPFLFLFVISSSVNSIENTTDKKILVVNASSLILREKPSRNSKQIMQLYSGRSVYLLEVTDVTDLIEGKRAKWYKISTKNNKIGYVFSGFLIEPESCENAEKYRLNDNIVQQYRKNTGNYWDGYEELEQYNLQKYKFISRTNDTLTIKLNNNKYITYKDIIPKDVMDEVNIKKHYFREYFEKVKYCIVSVAFYEGGIDCLINLNNGKNINIRGVPILPSPNNKYLLAISSTSAYRSSGIQIIKINDNGPIILYEKETEWNPITAKWINNSKVEITIQQLKQQSDKPMWLSGEDCYICKVHIININDLWTIEE